MRTVLGVSVAAACMFLARGPSTRAREAAPASAPASQPSGTFTIGKGTTRIAGPIRADGTLDYVAALNAEMSKGVTPASNAAIGLVRALGPVAFGIDPPKREKFFERLGIEPLPAGGGYYVGPDEFVDQNGEGDEAAKAHEALEKLHDKPWTAAEQPLLAKWVTSQDAAITRIADAVVLPKFYLPLVSKAEPQTMFGTVGGGLTAVRSAGRALAYRATFRLGEGDFEGFRSDVRNLSRLARQLASRPTFLDHLVAAGLDVLAVATITGSAASERLNAQQAKTLIADLDVTQPMPSAAAAIDVGERYVMLDYVGLAARHGWAKAAEMTTGGGGRARPLVYAGVQTPDWDAVFRKVNAWYDRFVAVIVAPTQAERDNAGKELNRELLKLQQRTNGPLGFMAPVEDRVMLLMTPSVRPATVIRRQGDLRREMCRVALALSAFHADHGKYPAKLDELAPRYLPKLPRDVFAKDSPDLMYEVNALGGYRLASVGENGKDDRDRAAQSFKVDDLVILGGKQPPPPPKPKDELELQPDAVDAPVPPPPDK